MERIRFTIKNGRPVEVRKDSVDYALQTLAAAAVDKKWPFSIRFDYYQKTYTVKVMAKSFSSADPFEALKKAIFFIAVAEGYVNKNDVPKT